MDLTRTLIVLARAPSAPGKTRLTAALPDDRARALRDALMRDTLGVARSLDLPVTVAYTPVQSGDEMLAVVDKQTPAASLVLRPQRGDDLGARMHHAIAESFAAGAGLVVLIGSDLPTLPSTHVADAFAELASGSDCVFGPTDDGGYYLVGVGRGAANYGRLFTDIPWSTDRVLASTLAAAHVLGLTTALLKPWFDVDVLDDLKRIVNDPQLTEERREFYRSFLP